MALKYNKTPAQICIQYCLMRNTLSLPKLTHKARILENFDLFFTIVEEDMLYLNSIVNEELKKTLRS